MTAAYALAGALADAGLYAVPRNDGTVAAALFDGKLGPLEIRLAIGGMWAWGRGGIPGTHPASDPDGAAAAVEEFLRAEEERL